MPTGVDLIEVAADALFPPLVAYAVSFWPVLERPEQHRVGKPRNAVGVLYGLLYGKPGPGGYPYD